MTSDAKKQRITKSSFPGAKYAAYNQRMAARKLLKEKGLMVPPSLMHWREKDEFHMKLVLTKLGHDPEKVNIMVPRNFRYLSYDERVEYVERWLGTEVQRQDPPC